jgi:hypothetical protein
VGSEAVNWCLQLLLANWSVAKSSFERSRIPFVDYLIPGSY